MSCLPQTWPTVFLWIKTIKATNAVQMLYSISSSKLHHTSGQWCIVTSNFLLFNIIIIYCLSHNLLSSPGDRALGTRTLCGNFFENNRRNFQEKNNRQIMGRGMNCACAIALLSLVCALVCAPAHVVRYCVILCFV